VEAGIEEERFRKREIEITKLMKQAQGVELQAPESSSVALEAKAEQLRQAQKAGILEARLRETAEPEERRRVQTEAERARALAGGAKFTAGALQEAEVKVAWLKRGRVKPVSYQNRQGRRGATV